LFVDDILNLIYRLQDEKQKVVQDYYCEAQHCDVQKDIIEKQKAEIERLKEMCSKSSYKDSWKNKFFKAQEEIERLTEENKELEKTVNDMSWIIKIHKYCVGANHCQNRSDGEFELQKQVDELKEERQTLVTKYNQTDEAVDYWCEKCKQAVKDTAKDIFDYAKDFFEWDEEGFVSSLKYALKKRYGVEVE
jgi:predicted RNase H-like nuclease (RuvC/YqgF family)